VRLANVSLNGDTVAARLEPDGLLYRLKDQDPIGASTDFLRLTTAVVQGAGIPPEEVRFLPPVLDPGRVICLGLNYRGHVAETEREVPMYPVLFCKWADSLVGAHDDILLPAESSQVDYEAEMAVIIGRPLRRASGSEARGAIAGLTVANDVTMRDYQYKSHQWLQGKAWPRSTPLGPYLVSGDEVDYGRALDISLELNGVRMQHSNTERMIFDVETTLSTLSEFVAFQPGDLILMGTPSGVGYRREPQVFLRHGDEVAVEIAGLGRLCNRVADEFSRAES
jgi:acylpyruvate hydrolase